MANSQLLRYDIYLPDKDLVDTLNAEVEAGGGPTINGYAAAAGLTTSVIVVNPFGPENAYFYMDPLNAAQVGAFTAFNGGVQLGAELPSSPLIPSLPAVLVSAWFTSDSNFHWDQRTFETCTGGWFGICALFGDETTYYWGARFVYQPQEDEDPETGTPIADPAPIPPRRWFDAFAMLEQGAFQTAGQSPWSRAATIWPGQNTGAGIMRHSGAVTYRSHTLTENTGGGASTVTQSWERIYWNLEATPNAEVEFWETSHTPSAAQGAEIRILPSGQLSVYSTSSLGNKALVGTTTDPVPLGVWQCMDLLYDTEAATLRIFLSHALIGTFNVGGEWSGTPMHASSSIRLEPGGDAGIWLKVGLWMNAEIPNKAGTESLDSADFVRGTRPVLLRARRLAADHGAWSGGFGIAMQNPEVNETDAAASSVSTVAQDVYSIETDAPEVWAAPGAMGVVGFNIGLLSHRGSTDGELGYNVNAGGDDYAAITQPNGSNPAWRNRLVDLASGMTAPLDTLDSLELKHRKGNDTDEGGVHALLAVLEVVGIFDACDVHPDAETEPPPPLPLPVHDSAYPTSPWGARQSEPTVGPVGIFAGTYVGTATEFELAFPLPVCFLVIRRVTGTADPNVYWSTAHLCSHEGIELGTRADLIKAVRLDLDFPPAADPDDPELQAIARISASDVVNANGVTYQYFAVADPAGRFHLAESLTGRLSMDNQTHRLQASDFSPLAAMLFAELVGNNSTSTAYMKGGNVGADAVVPMVGGTELTAALTFGTGALTIGNNSTVWPAFTSLDQMAALLVRENDGNGPFDVPAVKVIGWTGDGGGSRTIALDLGGKRPLMAWAAGGATGDGYYRDPSMTGTNSMDPDGGSHQPNGITGGGIDQVSVGSDLNANGVNYVMIVWPGSATAGEGGWSINGDFYPVEPDSAGDGIGTPQEQGGETPPTSPAEEPDLDNSTTLPGTALFCVDHTTKIANIALSRIGASERIEDLIAEDTVAADQVRLHIKHDVEVTLRDFQWPFATGRADLPLVAGSETTPANADWIYAYAALSDMIAARRLVNRTLSPDTRRGWDRHPPQFKVGPPDANNVRLIFTNLKATVDCPVTLEYTVRNSCPTYFGDPKFRDALEWRLAASLAPTLSRDQDRAKHCLAMYEQRVTLAIEDAADEQQQSGTDEGDADWIAGR